MKLIILAGLLTLLSIEPSMAETDVDKRRDPIKLFAASLPTDAGHAALQYEICVLKAPVKEGGTDTIVALKRRFSIACSKNVNQFRETLQRTETDPARVVKLINQLQQLVFDEVTVTRQDEPNPGTIPDPRFEEMQECERVMDREKAAFMACVTNAATEIAPFSKETADVVADAALGRCLSQKSQMTIAINRKCSFGAGATYDNEIEKFEKSVRMVVLSNIVAFRSELEKRRHTPPTGHPHGTDPSI